MIIWSETKLAHQADHYSFLSLSLIKDRHGLVDSESKLATEMYML